MKFLFISLYFSLLLSLSLSFFLPFILFFLLPSFLLFFLFVLPYSSHCFSLALPRDGISVARRGERKRNSSSLFPSLSLSRRKSRREESGRKSLPLFHVLPHSLFSLSLSLALPHSLSFSLSLSLATEISVARRDLFLFSLFLSLSSPLPLFLLLATSPFSPSSSSFFRFFSLSSHLISPDVRRASPLSRRISFLPLSLSSPSSLFLSSAVSPPCSPARARA